MKIILCSLLTFALGIMIVMAGCVEHQNTNSDYQVDQHPVDKITIGCVDNHPDYHIPPDYYLASEDYDFYVDEQRITTDDINVTYTILWAKHKLYPNRHPFIVSYFEGRCV